MERIEQRINTLEKKYSAPDERTVFYRKLYDVVVADPEVYNLALALAEQQGKFFSENPALYDQLMAGKPVTEEELSGVDLKLWARLAVLINEKMQPIEAETASDKG